MSAQFDQIKSILGVSAILSLYGIAAIGVWLLGSQLGLSVTTEIVILVILIATLPFVLLFAYWRKRRAARIALAAAQPEGAAEGGQPQSRASASPAGSYPDLSGGAEEAVQWLKSTRLGSTSKADNAIYALPWYLVTGPPASGKTSFVLSSGLNFHALPSQQGGDLQVLRPTRNCDWRVTDSAVLLDTTGRYQTESPARDEWSALLETIKKHRGARPLDGMLIAVSAEQLTRLKDPEIEQQAKLLRARVDEAMQRTRGRFPTYLVFTHVDAVEGFRDFFAPFTREERSQVWGATIPLQQAPNAHALFDSEFDQLYDTLMRRRLVRLGPQVPPAQSIRIFNFPPHLGAARAKLGLFASVLFRPTPFSESPLLRGFYFTANLNNNQPRRSAAADREVAPPPSEQEAGGEARALGHGFFTDRFFKEVLLRDKDIAATYQAQQRRPHYLRNALFGLLAALLLFLVAGTIVSFVMNRRLIGEATERGAHVNAINTEDAGKDPTKKEAAASRVEIEAAEDLRETLADLDEYDRGSRPLSVRFGLYSGEEINPDLRAIYFESITQRFFNNTAKAVEDDLRTFVSSGGSATPATAAAGATNEDVLGRHFDLLKAYKMLGDPSKVEPAFLSEVLGDYWKRFAPPEMELVALRQLDFYAKQADRDDAPHKQPDEKLIVQAVGKLRAYPMANRFYKAVIAETNRKAAPINLDSILQGSGGGVLEGTYTVPGSFTAEGYRKYIIAALASAGEGMSQDDWVLGGAAASDAKMQSADVAKLEGMYFREYTDQWRKLLKGTGVKEYKTKDEAVEALKEMSATDSPLQRVIETTVRNTNLSAEPEGTGLIARVKGWFGGGKEEGPAAPTNDVEKEFLPLRQFAPPANTKETTPISQYRAALQVAQESLESAPGDTPGVSPNPLQKSEQGVAKTLDGFKTAAAVDAASLLKQPLGNLRALQYGTKYAQIEKSWREQILPKARGIETGFPFTASGESSVTDIARFLNPTNGTLSVFFKEQLSDSFEEAQGQWKPKEGGFKFSDDLVGYLNNARRLREALFAGGAAQPEVSYEITLPPTPDADVVIEVDGQRVESRGTSSAKFTWPARAGSSTGATIKVVPTSGQIADAQPLSFPGEWGLFKMFAAGAPTKTPDGQFALTWTVGTVPVRATLRPASANNPFQGNLFSALRAPQSLQK